LNASDNWAIASGLMDITAPKSSSLERKNCMTSDGSTPASAATRRIVVPPYPSAAKRARAASRIA
jgi:hypothetical protein